MTLAEYYSYIEAGSSILVYSSVKVASSILCNVQLASYCERGFTVHST